MVISREILLTSRRFQIVRKTRRLPEGQIQVHESVQHPGAVAIVPRLSDGRVCLIRNYRMAVENWLVEVPAGTLEPGEDPLETARRELEEETGYRGGQFQKLGEMLMSPGILNERMHLFLATDLTAGPADLQPDEQIETLLLSWETALAMISTGEIQDAKTIAALLLCERMNV